MLSFTIPPLPQIPPHVLSDFVVPPGLWLKCNRLLRLGRPVGAVTLSRWQWWWNERWIWGSRGVGVGWGCFTICCRHIFM